MSSMTENDESPPLEPFLDHLLNLLTFYEYSYFPATPPTSRYNEAGKWKTEAILRSLTAIAKRMQVAEKALEVIRKVEILNGAEYATESNASLTAQSSSIVIPNISDLSNWTVSSNRTSHDSNISSTSRPLEYSSEPPLIIPPHLSSTSTSYPRIAADEELRLLKMQVSDIARICAAVSRGDLSHKITVPVQGAVMVQLKDVVNSMVDTLVQFTCEIQQALKGEEETICDEPLVHKGDPENIWHEILSITRSGLAFRNSNE